MTSANTSRAVDLTDGKVIEPTVRVLLIGGAPLMRAGLRMLIEGRPGIKVLGEGSTAEASIADAGYTEPDVVILDIDNDDDLDAALEGMRQVQRECTAARILILATRCGSEASRRIVLAGASGLVLKDKSPDHLLRAIRKVHEGELWVDRATTAYLISGMGNNRRHDAAEAEVAKIELLTRREREVVTLIAGGLNNKSIAVSLNISDNTVRHHLTSIFEKLNTHDRLELVVYAFRHKLVPLPPG